MNRNIKTLLIVEAYPWMGQHSGLIPLLRELRKIHQLEIHEVSGTLEGTFSGLQGKLLKRIWYRFPNSCSRRIAPYACFDGYNYGDYRVERRIESAVRKIKPDLVHHLFADTRHGYTTSLCQRLGIPFVATVHKPLSFRKLVNVDYLFLKKASAIITVGPEEKAEFEQQVSCPVHFLPHGVAHEFFVPANYQTAEPFTCITAGSHLRDYATLLKTVRIILAKDPQICFKIVIQPRHRKGDEFEGLSAIKQVSFLSGLSDTELVETYQSSHCLLLPLFTCTANNSLLEGISCGLPIITNDFPGTRAYTDPSFAELPPSGDAAAMAEAVLRLKAAPENWEPKRNSARRFAISNFDWASIAREHLELYRTID
ncbi:MAG: glycosyltransferase family 4 protein [Verrucomicrobiota bacterium]